MLLQLYWAGCQFSVHSSPWILISLRLVLSRKHTASVRHPKEITVMRLLLISKVIRKNLLDLAFCVSLNQVNEFKKLSYNRAHQVMMTTCEPLDQWHLQIPNNWTMQAEEHFTLTTRECWIIADYFKYSTCILEGILSQSLPHKYCSPQNEKVHQ